MIFSECLNQISCKETKLLQKYNWIGSSFKGEISQIAKLFELNKKIFIKKISLLINEYNNSFNSVPIEVFNIFEINSNSELNNYKEIDFSTRKNLFYFALKSEKEHIDIYLRLKVYLNMTQKKIIDKLIAEKKEQMFFIVKVLHQLN